MPKEIVVIYHQRGRGFRAERRPVEDPASTNPKDFGLPAEAVIVATLTEAWPKGTLFLRGQEQSFF